MSTLLKKILSVALAVSSLLLCLCGCTKEAGGGAVTDGTDVGEITEQTDVGGAGGSSSEQAALCDLALGLIRKSEQKGKNTLISPLSVACALAMTVNGAEDETLAQMESVLGMKTDELNSYLSDYLKSLPETDKYKLRLANSIWYSEKAELVIKDEFLKTNTDCYGADIRASLFDDSTLREINGWVNEKTDGAIPEMLDSIRGNEVMMLINALAFEAEWSSPYTESQIKKGNFTSADGKVINVEFMHGSENSYIEDDSAVGFIKNFYGGKYAFAALLPNEGTDVSDYLASLDGEKLAALLTSDIDHEVLTSIPVFKAEYDTELSAVLGEMGMPRAFDRDHAQFGGIGTSNGNGLYISRVCHKTYITIGALGAKAGAATSVIMAPGSAPPSLIQKKPKEVYLDRPFIYMLIDCERGIPFFIGTVNELGE